MEDSHPPARGQGGQPAEADAALGVLADLLAMAVERDRLVATDRLLRELVGPAPVDAAHRVWTARLRQGIERGSVGGRIPSATDAPPGSALQMLRRSAHRRRRA